MKYITQGQIIEIRGKYLSKIKDPASWIRLLTFRSDYSLLIKSMLQPLFGGKRNAWRPVQRNSTTDTTSHPPNSNLNPHFLSAFLSFIKERNMIMIFSGADRLYWEFEEKFMSVYREAVAPHLDRLEIHIIKDANHIFSFPEWQSEMLDISIKWLKSNHC
jgi:hypothetical protein